MLRQAQFYRCIFLGAFKSEFDDCDFVDVAVVESAAIARLGVPDTVTWECWLQLLTVAGSGAVATTCLLLGSLGYGCSCRARKYNIKLRKTPYYR